MEVQQILAFARSEAVSFWESQIQTSIFSPKVFVNDEFSSPLTCSAKLGN